MLLLLLCGLNHLEITEELSPYELNDFYETNLNFQQATPSPEPTIVKLEKLLPPKMKVKHKAQKLEALDDNPIFMFS